MADASLEVGEAAGGVAGGADAEPQNTADLTAFVRVLCCFDSSSSSFGFSFILLWVFSFCLFLVYFVVCVSFLCVFAWFLYFFC